MPQLPKHLSFAWIEVDVAKPMKLFALLSTILYLEQNIVSNSSIKERLLALFLRQHQSRLKAMGFPENWREQGLWTTIQ